MVGRLTLPTLRKNKLDGVLVRFTMKTSAPASAEDIKRRGGGCALVGEGRMDKKIRGVLGVYVLPSKCPVMFLFIRFQLMNDEW